MKVAVVGSGGREHALALALAADPSVTGVAVVPGNPGMAAMAAVAGDGRVCCVDADPATVDADLCVIGPEAPLVAGLADRLRAAGRLVFGPGADGARLEGSKAWMKDVLAGAAVPTAAYATFAGPDEAEAAVRYLRSLPPPWVVKTDGLAAGKGVLVTTDRAAAEADVRAKLAGAAFGDAGRRVVIEEGLTGLELSVLAVCDGHRAVALAPARDHKRVGDGDTGPNTGGMGAFSPVPGAGDAVVDEIMDRCVTPTLEALRQRGIDYRGILYAGLMLTPTGPRVVEFNVRFGDPETQVVLARFEGDLAALLAAAARGDLGSADPPRFAPGAAVHVVLAAGGYPEAPRNGDPLEPTRLAAAAGLPGVGVVAAGVGVGEDGGLRTAGGRVLGVTGTGPTLAAARERAYAGVDAVAWPGCHYRHDIAAGV